MTLGNAGRFSGLRDAIFQPIQELVPAVHDDAVGDGWWGAGDSPGRDTRAVM
ncbi:MAG: hypothetical protein H6656_13260 [Ardenticatenaceae bacterium]|nr:hypothetical protein [Ardenticatenaceae bacterium]